MSRPDVARTGEAPSTLSLRGVVGEVCFSVRDLEVRADTHGVLRAASLEIYRGEVTALVGPTGCGSSAFLRILNRLNELDPRLHRTGTVLFAGQDIHAPDTDLPELRRRVGLLFPQAQLFPCSVFQNVASGLLSRGIRDRDRLHRSVRESLEAVEVWDELRLRLNEWPLRFPDRLQQRLCLARLLALEPEVLLLDEPSAALEPVTARELDDLLLALSDRYTLVLATHDRYQAARLSNRAAFFHRGELVEVNRTEVLFERPSDPRTEAFLCGRAR